MAETTTPSGHVIFTSSKFTRFIAACLNSSSSCGSGVVTAFRTTAGSLEEAAVDRN